jgi:hypothetical protein
MYKKHTMAGSKFAKTRAQQLSADLKNAAFCSLDSMRASAVQHIATST